MNQAWRQFLISQGARIEGEADVSFAGRGGAAAGDGRKIYAPAHLGALQIAGRDAAAFLQGQITCDINNITETQGGIGAFCNAKGRVITTFVLVKEGRDFLMIMPVELLPRVRERLQKYILRAAVDLTDAGGADAGNGLCLLGWSEPSAAPHFSVSRGSSSALARALAVVVPDQRILLMADPETAEAVWRAKTRSDGFLPADTSEWRYLDILAGLPWLTAATSEEFIPQMLNIDKLGGVSFTKGCYTGQEIVARTHYLGRNKREMALAESDAAVAPPANTPVMKISDGQTVGHVVQAEKLENTSRMLIVLQAGELSSDDLCLRTEERAGIRLLTL